MADGRRRGGVALFWVDGEDVTMQGGQEVTDPLA
jgi:hypothetical protein